MLNIITRKDTPSDEEGFTLLQLVIVVAILGILVAIAVPAHGAIVKESRKTAFATQAEKIADVIVARFIQDGGTLAGSSNSGFAQNSALMDRISREVVREMDPGWGSHDYTAPPKDGRWINYQGIVSRGEWPGWEIGPGVDVYDLEGGVTYQYPNLHYYSGSLE